jgi:hypothetical protein
MLSSGNGDSAHAHIAPSERIGAIRNFLMIVSSVGRLPVGLSLFRLSSHAHIAPSTQGHQGESAGREFALGSRARDHTGRLSRRYFRRRVQ